MPLVIHSIKVVNDVEMQSLPSLPYVNTYTVEVQNVASQNKNIADEPECENTYVRYSFFRNVLFPPKNPLFAETGENNV